MLASSPLVSGYFEMLACCLGCVLSLFIPVPCVILASGVFLSGWLLGPLSGLTPGGFPSWLVALVGSCPPSLCVRLAVSRLCISLHPPCALFSYWGQVFHLVVRAYPGLLALHGLGVLPFFLFSDLFCFVFSLSRFLGFAVPLVVPVRVFLFPVALLPWPACLSLGPGVS